MSDKPFMPTAEISDDTPVLVNGEVVSFLEAKRRAGVVQTDKPTEIVADLRDDLLITYTMLGIKAEEAQDLADETLATIKRWCAKEPVNDNEA